jgi:hypothetical protein
MDVPSDTVATPYGQAWRCSAQAKGTGQRCRKPAIRDSAVCGTHGRGYPRRQVARTRKDPRLAALLVGEHATAATVNALYRASPGLADRVTALREQLRPPFDWLGLVARAQALCDLLEQDVKVVKLPDGRILPPPLLRGLQALRRIMWAAEASHARAGQIAEREQRGPDYVHRDLVNGLIRNTVSVLEAYLAPEQFGEAVDRIRELQAALTAR